MLPEPKMVTLPNGGSYVEPVQGIPVKLSSVNGQLAASPGADFQDLTVERTVRRGEPIPILSSPVAYFIPEGVPDPSVRRPDEELWVEVTIPRKGLPRPIQLGVKKDGVLTPIRY